jgi:hypothetical protein
VNYEVKYPNKMVYKDGLNELFIEKNRNRIHARDINIELQNEALRLKKKQMIADMVSEI